LTICNKKGLNTNKHRKEDAIVSRILAIIGLAVLVISPLGYAAEPRSVGSGVNQLPPVNPQDAAKRERMAHKKLNDLRQQQHKSKVQTLRVERLFNAHQRRQFAEICKLATQATRKARALNQLKSKWANFVQDIAQKDPLVDIDALVQAAMFELYQQESQSLEQALQQLHRLNELKRQTRKELNRARQHRKKMSVRQRDGGTLPLYRPEKIADVTSKSSINSLQDMSSHIQQLENKLNSVGDDAQLANIELQNALQKQQQLLQIMSQISKMLHDSAAAIIRKIG
jgi:hypothetical protein